MSSHETVLMSTDDVVAHELTLITMQTMSRRRSGDVGELHRDELTQNAIIHAMASGRTGEMPIAGPAAGAAER